MNTIDISIQSLIIFYAILIIPISLSLIFRLRLTKTVLISVARMTVQMALVGVYLEFLFRLNYAWLNLVWVLAMIVIANFTILKRAGLKMKVFFPYTMTGLVIASLLVGVLFIVYTVRPVPLYDAPYLIPIMGMMIGNGMRGNILSLERLYSTIRKNEKEFLTYLLMGATLTEAVVQYMREAIRPAFAPILSTMTTLGLVSLPGMMTGQILGGASPLVAIKYQIGIMLAIFAAIFISCFINVFLTMRVAFDDYQMLRKDIFNE
jgi:putative ABC transport system permease protein